MIKKDNGEGDTDVIANKLRDLLSSLATPKSLVFVSFRLHINMHDDIRRRASFFISFHFISYLSLLPESLQFLYKFFSSFLVFCSSFHSALDLNSTTSRSSCSYRTKKRPSRQRNVQVVTNPTVRTDKISHSFYLSL